MTPFGEVWLFTRERLAQSLTGLSEKQMLWRPFAGGHNIMEYVYHIAGAEYYWAARLSGRNSSLSEWETNLDQAVFESFLREGVCPFGKDQMTQADMQKALDFTYGLLRPILESPTEKQLAMPLISPIGDSVNGKEGLKRVCQHASYHTGQIWLLRQMMDHTGKTAF